MLGASLALGVRGLVFGALAVYIGALYVRRELRWYREDRARELEAMSADARNLAELERCLNRLATELERSTRELERELSKGENRAGYGHGPGDAS